ncbi:hypothetical protein RSOLAG22IIIB_09064 [Rhizoctonia solani]|uniref:DUF6532 domain-containing protein n=1 Tax=Rhizoctonia solani TaxID=456999 RepID=A0A0K6FWU7_9AGAM|nr:hypothetical protein RSOLAG22IIIB_09064 [Rhizoctonia solani]
MARKRKVAVLTPPLIPVDVDAPQALRHKRSNDNGPDSSSSDLVTEERPTKVLKSSTSTSLEGAMPTLKLTEPGITTKKKNNKKSAPAVDADQEMDDPTTGTPLEAPNAQLIATGQTTIDDSLVPTKSKGKRKKKDQTSASTVHSDTPEATIDTADDLVSTAVPPPIKRKGKKVNQEGGDVVTKEADKQNRKAAEAKRTLKKTQMATIHETQEATAAFLANTQAQTTHATISPSSGLHSRGPSLVPPSRVASLSRASSTVPSVQSESIPAGANSAQAEGLSTLAEYYLGIPQEFAPHLPKYDPLPEPLRDIERLYPVPEQDVTQLNNVQLREYRKALKVEIKDLTKTDSLIVSSALSRLEALMNTMNCFPTNEDLFHYMLVANAWACRKHNLGNLRLIEGSPYEELLFARSSQMRSAIVKAVGSKVPHRYKFSVNKNDKAAQSNAKKATSQLADANFVCPPNDLGALYENKLFEDVFETAFFTKANSAGITHRDLWKTITIPALAMVATAVEKVLMDYVNKGQNTGAKPLSFSKDLFSGKYLAHISTLCLIFKLEDPSDNRSGSRLAQYLTNMGSNLLAKYPKKSTTLTTLVEPRIPMASILKRYGRSIPVTASTSSLGSRTLTIPNPPAESESESESNAESESDPESEPESSKSEAESKAKLVPQLNPQPPLKAQPESKSKSESEFKSKSEFEFEFESGAEDHPEGKSTANPTAQVLTSFKPKSDTSSGSESASGTDG